MEPVVVPVAVVTVTAPVLPDGGADTVSVVLVALLTVAFTPLNFTVLFAGVASKFAPVIVTVAPATPDVGFIDVIEGDGAFGGGGGGLFFLQLATDNNTTHIKTIQQLLRLK